MKFLVLLVMLTASAAVPQDMSGKMFTFPEVTDTAHVKLNTSREEFSAVTVCLRYFTELDREYSLFSLATPSFENDFLIFWNAAIDSMKIFARDEDARFRVEDNKFNTWHSVCCTWDAASGRMQVWFDGQPSVKKFVRLRSNIRGLPIIVLGQEQDSYGGMFLRRQCFFGMMSEVHMWDYVLSPCEIHNYMDDLIFTPGNVLNWRALDFLIVGRVLIEDKLIPCHETKK